MAATGTGIFVPLVENVPRSFPNRPPRRPGQVAAERTMTRTNDRFPPAPSAFSAQEALVLTTFEQRLEGLEAKLHQMGQMVQSQLDRTLEALSSRDTVLANEVIVRDDAIDTAYREVEEEILRTLALQAPVAKDLRLVAGVLHINSHIERMGDLCVNMAKFVRIVRDYPPVPEIQTTLLEMGSVAQKMVTAAMTCFARRDVELAERLPIMDQPLDRLNAQIFNQIERAAEDDSTLEWASRMILVSRYLERLGDHSVDIGEQVVFIVTGEVRELVPSKAARAGVVD
jgi:phosphate transport system protein